MIDDTSFSKIIVEGKSYDHDIVIFPDKIIRRKKEITKEKHGTSHKFTREEMEEYLNEIDPRDIEQIVIGMGQYGKLGLLPETKEYLEKHDIEYTKQKTPDLVGEGEDYPRDRTVFIIHVTC